MGRIRKILVANRGEIALRIIRSAREMGISTVAVYSDCDRVSPHVISADEAYCIGTAASRDSYLRADKIIEVCRATGVDALHPGYGFLSENPDFVRIAEEAGIVFIGPGPESMLAMGVKINAKRIARAAGVPCIAGSDDEISNVADAAAVAGKIGYPVLLKASAGGGGKGMRIVHRESGLAEALARARSEALDAFGNDAVFVEKYIQEPKHIEIQILGDQQGSYVYFPERDCSVQRRYQKVVEESPSVFLTRDVWTRMGEAAVRIARGCGYTNAGTVEFIVDKAMNFYFLEMNSRLQVEHTVTEAITGVDLVKEQIRIASGQPLTCGQGAVQAYGHAIELRVYAEDPETDFLPDSGIITQYSIPSGIGVRVDDGYRQGMEVPVHYDPMISKLIAYGRDREEAIARLIRAVDEYRIEGVKNTLLFGKKVLLHPKFIDGDFDTSFVSRYLADEANAPVSDDGAFQKAGAIFAAALYGEHEVVRKQIRPAGQNSKWKNRSWD